MTIGDRSVSTCSSEGETAPSCFSHEESCGSDDSLCCTAMQHEMWIDLGGNEEYRETCRVLKDSPGLVNDLLPDSAVGFNVSEAAEKFGQLPLPIFDYRLRRKNSDASAKGLQGFRDWAEYLETLIAPMLSGHPRGMRRRWVRHSGDEWAGYNLVPLPEEQSPILTSPIHAILRVSLDRLQAEQCIAISARDLFCLQRNRRFVLGIAMADGEMSILLVDRAGVVVSEVYNVKERFDILLRVCVGLLFVDPTHLGYDPAFTFVRGKTHVCVNGDLYEVKRGILKDYYLEGTGIRITLLQKDGKEYVMKDVWIERGSGSKEFEMLKKVSELNIEGAARFVSHDAIQVNGEVDSTERARRSWIKEYFPDEYARCGLIKEHHRMVSTPYGVPLQCFRSLDELVSALKDVALTIQALDEHGLMHRDISTENIILVGNGSDHRKGILIDFEFADTYDFNEMPLRTDYAAGSVSFISHRVLRFYSPKYFDDLESLLYVLCWICSSQAGPDDEVRYFSTAEKKGCNGAIGANTRMDDDDDYEDLARRRYDFIKTPDAFENVVKDFHPYFHPLRPLAEGLRGVLLDMTIDTVLGEVGVETLPRKTVFAQFIQEFNVSLDKLKGGCEVR